MRTYLSMLAGALLPLLYTSTSFAQSVALTGIVTRTTHHSAALPSNIVNHADCVADDTITVPLALSGALGQGLILEAWAGEGVTDCTVP